VQTNFFNLPFLMQDGRFFSGYLSSVLTHIHHGINNYQQPLLSKRPCGTSYRRNEWDWSYDSKGTVLRSLFPRSLTKVQGLVANGAKVYVCGLESDPISQVSSTLNELGKSSGGSAIGYANTCPVRWTLSQPKPQASHC
jgi:hypothetical protein